VTVFSDVCHPVVSAEVPSAHDVDAESTRENRSMRGIGAAAVSTLVAEGARVVSFDVTDDPGMAVAQEANAAGPGTARFRHTDVSDRAEVGGRDKMITSLPPKLVTF